MECYSFDCRCPIHRWRPMGCGSLCGSRLSCIRPVSGSGASYSGNSTSEVFEVACRLSGRQCAAKPDQQEGEIKIRTLPEFAGHERLLARSSRSWLRRGIGFFRASTSSPCSARNAKAKHGMRCRNYDAAGPVATRTFWPVSSRSAPRMITRSPGAIWPVTSTMLPAIVPVSTATRSAVSFLSSLNR